MCVKKPPANHAGLWAGNGQVKTGGFLGLASQLVKRVSYLQQKEETQHQKNRDGKLRGTLVSTFVSQYTQEYVYKQVSMHTDNTHTCTCMHMHTDTHTKLLPFYRYQRPTEQSWFITAKKRDIHL